MHEKRNSILPTVVIILIILVIIAVVFSFFILNLEKTKIRQQDEEGSIHLCFTQQTDCTEVYLDLILNSSSSKAAVYELNYAPIKEALEQKNSEVLIFEDNHDDFGEPIPSKGLMHDKFYLIYNHSGKNYVITGSTNPTNTDLFKNDNNILIIESKTVFENYEEEFNELKAQRGQMVTRKPLINLSGRIVKNYFCPEDNCEEKVLMELKGARSSIHFMTFSFTSDDLAYEILLKDNLTDLRGIFDKSQVASNKEYSAYYDFKDSAVKVKISDSTGKLHHKVFIIDNETVITGSYNPTASGNTRNDENIIIIHDANVAKAYNEEFERIWNSI